MANEEKQTLCSSTRATRTWDAGQEYLTTRVNGVMSQHASEPEELALRHKIFEELYELVDIVLRELGAPDGVLPQPEDSVKVEVPIPSEESQCFHLGDNRVTKVEITVGSLRTGRSRGKKREEITIDIAGEMHKGEERAVFTRRIFFTAQRGESHRDLWVDVPELKRRWSLFHGFVEYELGGAFKPAPLSSNVDEATEKKLVYSLRLTITGMIENFKKIGLVDRCIEDILELL